MQVKSFISRGILAVIFILSVTCAMAAVKEFRGVWLRPAGDDTAVIKALDDLKQANINVIFVETFYTGYTIYPSNVFEQRPEFVGGDRLKLIITEAHKRNIEVHAWFHTLFWWYGEKDAGPFLTKNPDWIDYGKNGKTTRETEMNYWYVNPSVPEVRKKLNSLVQEVTQKYDVDGVHFDYIRYAANGDSWGFGYNQTAMNKFRRKYKINPNVLDPAITPDAWDLWNTFREDQLTELVGELSKTAKKTRGKCKVSAAVFPDYYNERYTNSKMQNYQDWCQKGYLNFLTPMCYSYAIDGIVKEIQIAREHTGNTPIYPGLAARKGTPHPDFPTQIELVRKENPAGHSLFAYNWMVTYPGLFEELGKGLYKDSAIAW